MAACKTVHIEEPVNSSRLKQYHCMVAMHWAYTAWHSSENFLGVELDCCLDDESACNMSSLLQLLYMHYEGKAKGSCTRHASDIEVMHTDTKQMYSQ